MGFKTLPSKLSDAVLTVANVAALSGVSDPQEGDERYVADIDVLYMYTGAAWAPSASSSGAPLAPSRGGTGISNNDAATLTRTGNHAVTITTTGTTGVTLPTSGTLVASGAIVDADINAGAAIVDTKLATIATAGKVSNSATTATNANTASAIVARDGSGNFTAGTITANLTGNASGTAANVTGVVALANGGTNKNMTAVAGGVVYSDADSLEVTAGGIQGKALVSAGSGAPIWSAPLDTQNLAISTSVGSNALTIALKTQLGADPSSTDFVTLPMRSTTATNGGHDVRTVSVATSLVISSGSTLGHTSAVEGIIYVYALWDTGSTAVKLAASSTLYDTNKLATTTAEGGAGAADSLTALYSDAVYTSMPIRLIGKLYSTQTTAGTWAAVPTAASVIGMGQEPRFRGQPDLICARDGAGQNFGSWNGANSLTLSMATELLDRGGDWSTNTWTCRTPGYYCVSIYGSVIKTAGTATAGDALSVGIYKNGSGYGSGQNVEMGDLLYHSYSQTQLVEMKAGDTMTVVASYNAGGARTMSGTIYFPTISIRGVD